MATEGRCNPSGVAHGKHCDDVHNAGDLPSLGAGDAGTTQFSVKVNQLRVSNGTVSVVGKRLIVHLDPVDYKA